MLIQTIHTYIHKHQLLPAHAHVVLGLSGGPDSVFLFHLLADLHHQGSIRLTAAHLDHQWRQNSCADAKFCADLSASRAVPFVQTTIALLALPGKPNGSLEAWARTARRFFLEQVLTNNNAQAIALAHHADDQRETFFIRLIRGASLAGLTAMSSRQGSYIRPLLATNKAEILAYLHEHNLPYLQDPTNNTSAFLRNRIRATVLPALVQADKRFESNMAHTMRRLQEAEDLLARYTQERFEQIQILGNQHVGISIPLFLQEEPAMQYRLIMHWILVSRVPCIPSTKFFDEIIRFFKQQKSTTHQLNSQWRIIKKKNSAYTQAIL